MEGPISKFFILQNEPNQQKVQFETVKVYITPNTNYMLQFTSTPTNFALNS